jgi:hypothetical protein
VINFGGIKFFPEEVEQIRDAIPPCARAGSAVSHTNAGAPSRWPNSSRTPSQHRRRRPCCTAANDSPGYKVPARPPDRRAATHAEREAAAMKPAKAWVWKAGVVPVRAFYQRGPEAVSRPARPARHAVDSAKYG